MTELENKMAALKLLQSETNDKVRDYQQQIADLQKQIDDYNKPELTPAQLDDIQEAIEKAVENYSFSDCDNYEVEYGLDYDGRVHLESIDLSCSYELIEMIVNKVHNLFKEAECPEELDTTEPDNHPVEKLQQ
tara:strand:+ start:79 stop:477 length:399 start_codon:yes stop_codon:yes gene_type:complete